MRKQLYSKITSVKNLRDEDIQSMFSVFSKYYDKISPDVFKSDLSKKDDVILLFDKKDSSLKGFSTLLHYEFILEGQKVFGVFSGDTILEKEYWGGSVLQKAFSRYMFNLKLSRPLSPLYWFLISKGYKTYLLMTNNFSTHFPRFDEQTPSKFKSIMDKFAMDLYPDNYNSLTGLIEFPEVHDHLKDNVAPITEEMKSRSPQIKFFSEVNQNWQRGSELVCLAEFTLMTPLNYLTKIFKKMIQSFYVDVLKSLLNSKKEKRV